MKIVKALTLGLVLASMSAIANNPPPTIKADAPNRYVVKKGDTLWDISGKYLNQPTRWREIWATNKQIKNPHLIYPNDILILCIIKGQTLVGVDTGEGCAGVEKQMTGEAPTQMAVTSYEDSVPAIPLSTIKHWLNYAVIVGPQDFEQTPYILASKNGNIITSVGDKVYARGEPLIVGQRYGIYHKGQPYIDTRTGQVIGLEATQVAAAEVESVTSAGISSLKITNTYGYEISEGDRVFVEVDAPMPPVFYPAPANVGRGALIVRVMDSGMNTINTAAKRSVVSVNVGTEDGARPGQVFDIYKKGKLIRDVNDNDAPVRLPSELVGKLMIFKSFNKISYAYILSADVPLNPGDQLLPAAQ